MTPTEIRVRAPATIADPVMWLCSRKISVSGGQEAEFVGQNSALALWLSAVARDMAERVARDYICSAHTLTASVLPSLSFYQRPSVDIRDQPRFLAR